MKKFVLALVSMVMISVACVAANQEKSPSVPTYGYYYGDSFWDEGRELYVWVCPFFPDGDITGNTFAFVLNIPSPWTFDSWGNEESKIKWSGSPSKTTWKENQYFYFVSLADSGYMDGNLFLGGVALTTTSKTLPESQPWVYGYNVYPPEEKKGGGGR